MLNFAHKLFVLKLDSIVESCALQEGLYSGMGICFWYPCKVPDRNRDIRTLRTVV